MTNKSGRKNEKIINIAMIGAAPFDLLTRDKEVEIFAISLQDVDYELKKKSKKVINSEDIVSEEYHDFLNVFFKEKADILFSHRKYDHKIELLKEKEVFIRAFLYRMSEGELQIIKNYLKEHLDKDFIMINSTFFASSILFV